MLLFVLNIHKRSLFCGGCTVTDWLRWYGD